MTPSLKVLPGDCIEQLRTLPDSSVHMCVTSPPYWGLRDYGIAGQIGLEKTPEEYIAKMVEVFGEVKRVLRADGTAWVNLGDSYAATTKGSGGHNPKQDSNAGSWHSDRTRQIPSGLKPKDLVGIPWRVAFALQADGWYLRSDIIWHKPNPMPESVTDRPTKAHEYIFLLTKKERYFYDAEAIKENAANTYVWTAEKFKCGDLTKHHGSSHGGESVTAGGTRNRRTVWTVPSTPYKGAHFATFPPDLIKPCILAGTSERGCCPKCGSPWERVLEKSKGTPESFNGSDFRNGKKAAAAEALAPVGQQERTMSVKTTGWRQTCDCGQTDTVPATVLDPFGGSGTTGQVSLELGRSAVLIELNPEYVEQINLRTAVTPAMI